MTVWWGEPRLVQTKYQCLLSSCVAMPVCLTPAAEPELPVHLCRALAPTPGVPQAFLLTAIQRLFIPFEQLSSYWCNLLMMWFAMSFS